MKKTKLARKIFFGFMLAVIFVGLCFIVMGIVMEVFTKEASAATNDEALFIGPLREGQHMYVGYHDESSCANAVRGWVKDVYSDKPVKIGIWIDWPHDSLLAEKTGEVVADELREDLPFESQHYGFSWKFPEKYLNDTYTYYVYALNEKGEPAKLLNRSEKKLYCGDEDHLFSPGDHIWIMVNGLRARSGPGVQYPMKYTLSKWMNFRIEDIMYDKNGEPWYRIGGDDERLKRFGSSNLYIIANPHYIKEDVPITVPLLPDTVKRWIEIERTGSPKKVSVYEENAVGVITKRAEFLISTGLNGRTRVGDFKVYVDNDKDHRRRLSHMRGYACNKDKTKCWIDFDLTAIGYVIYYDGLKAFHIRYWRLNEEDVVMCVPFGGELSHGCINEPPDAGKWFWHWLDSTLPGEKFVPVISR